MQITLVLTSEAEARLRESVGRGDTEAVRRVLAEALTPTVEALLRESPTDLTADEFEAIGDQLAVEFREVLGPTVPPLSDYAISREGIYEDHP